MYIEYKIHFDSGGVRVSQRVNPDGDDGVLPQVAPLHERPQQGLLPGTTPQATPRSAGQPDEKHLGQAFPGIIGEPLGVRGGGDPPRLPIGGGDPPRLPIGGGDPPRLPVGGGFMPPSTLVISFGPVIINNSGSASEGGGDPPPIKTG